MAKALDFLLPRNPKSFYRIPITSLFPSLWAVNGIRSIRIYGKFGNSRPNGTVRNMFRVYILRLVGQPRREKGMAERSSFQERRERYQTRVTDVGIAFFLLQPTALRRARGMYIGIVSPHSTTNTFQKWDASGYFGGRLQKKTSVHAAPDSDIRG